MFFSLLSFSPFLFHSLPPFLQNARNPSQSPLRFPFHRSSFFPLPTFTAVDSGRQKAPPFSRPPLLVCTTLGLCCAMRAAAAVALVAAACFSLARAENTPPDPTAVLWFNQVR